MTKYHSGTGGKAGTRKRRSRRSKHKATEVEIFNEVVPDLIGTARFMERWIVNNLRKQAAKGKAGRNGKRQRKLNPRYAKAKTAAGGQAKPDFEATGQLLKSVSPGRREKGGSFIVVRVEPKGRRNMRVAKMLELIGRDLFDLGKKDIARLVRALKKSGKLITNKDGRGSSASFRS